MASYIGVSRRAHVVYFQESIKSFVSAMVRRLTRQNHQPVQKQMSGHAISRKADTVKENTFAKDALNSGQWLF